MVYEIKKLNVWSVAKISFVLGALFGFLAGLLLWMFADMLSQFPLSDLGDVEGASGLGRLSAVLPFVLAVFYAVAAMIVNGIVAGVYNLLAGLLGGIELTLAAPQPAYTAPAVPQPPAGPPVAPPGPPPASSDAWGTPS